MIKIRCTWCQRLLGVADDKAGAEVLCKCGQPVPVPADGSDAAPRAAPAADDFSALVSAGASANASAAGASKSAEHDLDHHPAHLRAYLPSPMPPALAQLGTPKRLYKATFMQRGPLMTMFSGGIMLCLFFFLMTQSAMREMVVGSLVCMGAFGAGVLFAFTMIVLPLLAAESRIIIFQRGFILMRSGKTKIFPFDQIQSVDARRVQINDYVYYEYTITRADGEAVILGDSWDDVGNLVRRIRRGAKLLEE